MKLSKLIPALVILVLVTVSSFAVAALGNANQTAKGPEPLENPIMVRDENAPALTSLAALYAPAEDKAHWIRLICAGMTEGGCEFFKANQADAMWQSQTGHDASSVGGYVSSEAMTINETSQVWKAQTTIFAPEENSFDVFILVERGRDGSWYLNRVLYGPGISQ